MSKDAKIISEYLEKNYSVQEGEHSHQLIDKNNGAELMLRPISKHIMKVFDVTEEGYKKHFEVWVAAKVKELEEAKKTSDKKPAEEKA